MKDKLLLKNAASLIFSNFSVQALRLLTIILLSRNLGPELFGAYNYILLLVSVSAIVVEFGLKNYAIREFALERGSRGLVRKIFAVRSSVCLVAVFIVVALTYQAFRSAEMVVIALIFSTSLFIDVFLIDFVAIAQEKLHLQALGQILQAAFYLVFVYLVLNHNADLKIIGAIFAVSHVLWVATFFMGIDAIPAEGNNNKVIFKVMKEGFPFLTANILGTLQSQMDIFLLGQFHFSSLLGDYSACLKLVSIPLGVVNALVASVQPRLAKNIKNKTELLKLLKKYIKPLLLFILLMNFVIFLFSRELVHLFFGDKYVIAHILLPRLSLVTSVFIISLLPLHALFVSEETTKLLRITFVNFTVGFIVIWVTLHFNKPMELPWAMLLVQCICAIQAWRVFLKK